MPPTIVPLMTTRSNVCWAKRPVARESLHDLFFNPGEGRNLVGDPSYEPVLTDLRARLERWMQDTSDPLLEGPVVAPTGARINAQDQLSADEPTYTVDAPGMMTRATAA